MSTILAKELDTVAMTSRLPEDKLADLKERVLACRGKVEGAS